MADASESIQQGLRLGWQVAEVRGRLRLGDDPRLAPASVEARTDNALPLAVERSAAEQRIESQCVLARLSQDLGLDVAATLVSEDPMAKDMTAAGYMTDQAIRLHVARRKGDSAAQSAAWSNLTSLFYAWDARMQDQLAGGPFGTASAYQLGRATAEIYWSLDPSAPQGPKSWSFLLGTDRCTAITALIDRLNDTLPRFTGAALKASLGDWHALAGAADRTPPPTAVETLRDQNRIWRDLLLTWEDPTALVTTGDVLRRARRMLPLLRSYWPELVLLAFAVAALTFAASFLVTQSGDARLTAPLAAVGVSGATVASLSARLKTTAQDMTQHLRDAMYLDEVLTATKSLPGLHRGR